MEPKVTDRVDAVSKAGVSKQTREVNIERFKKRFALHFSFFQYSIFNLQPKVIDRVLAVGKAGASIR